VAERLVAGLAGSQPVVIDHDAYYRDRSALPVDGAHYVSVKTEREHPSASGGRSPSGVKSRAGAGARGRRS
jgi:uridine kinase